MASCLCWHGMNIASPSEPRAQRQLLPHWTKCIQVLRPGDRNRRFEDVHSRNDSDLTQKAVRQPYPCTLHQGLRAHTSDWRDSRKPSYANARSYAGESFQSWFMAITA